MLSLPIIIACAALAAPPQADASKPPPVPVPAPAAKRAAVKIAKGPSRDRVSDIKTTIKHRRAFRARYRGNAERQREQLGPVWNGSMAGGWQGFSGYQGFGGGGFGGGYGLPNGVESPSAVPTYWPQQMLP